MLTADILGPDLIIVIIVGVIVLLFGGSKLPKLARGLGSASHEFKKGLAEGAEPTEGTGTTQASASAPPAVTSAPPSAPAEAPRPVQSDPSAS